LSGTCLDLRGRKERAAEERWRRWEDAPPLGTRPLRALTDALLRAGVGRRVGSRPAPPRSPLLVSIGNLRVGGTGKTPLVRDCALRLGARGLRGAVLVRGYGSAETGPATVHVDDVRCGDEARLLAGDLRGWTVVQSHDRAVGLAHLLRVPEALDVILLEDAHQTARLPRHLDFLVLDRWDESAGLLRPTAGRLLPWGPYREDAAGARRADALIVVLDAAAPAPPRRSTDGQPVLVCRRRLTQPAGWPDAGSVALGLVAGVARPSRFESDVVAAFGLAPVLTVRCDDHAAYPPALVARILDAGEAAGVTHWLTTGKDRVKLSESWPVDAAPLLAAGLELDWLDDATPAALVAARLED
jgi:tetraacyldisaccharide 4'-kinase